MKGLSIWALLVTALACATAQDSNDAAVMEEAPVLDKAEDDASLAEARCNSCHPDCPTTCKPPITIKPTTHKPTTHKTPPTTHKTYPPVTHKPYCPICPSPPHCPIKCPPPIHCPHCPIIHPCTCKSCPKPPPCPACPTTKPPHCHHPHPTLIGVCLDLELGIDSGK